MSIPQSSLVTSHCGTPTNQHTSWYLACNNQNRLMIFSEALEIPPWVFGGCFAILDSPSAFCCRGSQHLAYPGQISCPLLPHNAKCHTRSNATEDLQIVCQPLHRHVSNTEGRPAKGLRHWGWLLRVNPHSGHDCGMLGTQHPVDSLACRLLHNLCHGTLAYKIDGWKSCWLCPGPKCHLPHLLCQMFKKYKQRILR